MLKTYASPKLVERGGIVTSTEFLTVSGQDNSGQPQDKLTGPASTGFML